MKTLISPRAKHQQTNENRKVPFDLPKINSSNHAITSVSIDTTHQTIQSHFNSDMSSLSLLSQKKLLQNSLSQQSIFKNSMNQQNNKEQKILSKFKNDLHRSYQNLEQSQSKTQREPRQILYANDIPKKPDQLFQNKRRNNLNLKNFQDEQELHLGSNSNHNRQYSIDDHLKKSAKSSLHHSRNITCLISPRQSSKLTLSHNKGQEQSYQQLSSPLSKHKISQLKLNSPKNQSNSKLLSELNSPINSARASCTKAMQFFPSIYDNELQKQENSDEYDTILQEDKIKQMHFEQLQDVMMSSSQRKQIDQFQYAEQQNTMEYSIRAKIINKKKNDMTISSDNKVQIGKQFITEYKLLLFILSQKDINKEELIYQLNKMGDIAHEYADQSPKYYLNFLLLRCLIFRDVGEIKTCFLKFKELRIYCNIYKELQYKLVVYKEEARMCIDIKNFQKAEIYLQKYLKLAWKLNNTDAEISIYDIIGLNYYYQGKTDIAQYFHWRYSNDKVEPEHSVFRKQIIDSLQKQKAQKDIYTMSEGNDLKTDSEEEFQLESLQNSVKKSQHISSLTKNRILIPIKLRKRQKIKIGRLDKDKVYVDEECQKQQLMSHMSANRNVSGYIMETTDNLHKWNFINDEEVYCRYMYLELNLKQYKKQIVQRIKYFESVLKQLEQV